MNSKYDIAFDLDDVIFQTSSVVVERLIADGKIPSNFTENDLHCSNIERIFGSDYIKASYLHGEVFTDEFFLALPVNKEVVKDIKYLIENGVKVCFITSRDVTQYRCSVQALESLGIEDPEVHICTTSLKAKLASQFGVRILVDDRPEVAFSAQVNSITPFVPKLPYNYYIAKFGIAVDDWHILRDAFFDTCRDYGILNSPK